MTIQFRCAVLDRLPEHTGLSSAEATLLQGCYCINCDIEVSAHVSWFKAPATETPVIHLTFLVYYQITSMTNAVALRWVCQENLSGTVLCFKF